MVRVVRQWSRRLRRWFTEDITMDSEWAAAQLARAYPKLIKKPILCLQISSILNLLQTPVAFAFCFVFVIIPELKY